jgi:hypothetical protein
MRTLTTKELIAKRDEKFCKLQELVRHLRMSDNASDWRLAADIIDAAHEYAIACVDRALNGGSNES